MKYNFPAHLNHAHTSEDINLRLSKGSKQSYLRDFVYGAIDGTVTTFAVVSGVVGAQLDAKTIIILGMANLIADGFSMAASNYLGSKAEIEERNLLEQFEHKEIKDNPIGETQEVIQILRTKGFTGELLQKTKDLYTKDEQGWVDFMLKEEYGLSSPGRLPLKAALITFMAFVLFGLIPLLPYLLDMGSTFKLASILTGIAFFLIGSLKTRWTCESYISAGFKTLLIGASAASLAYVVGVLLSK